MDEIEVNKVKNLTVPASVNAVQIVHEWGDVIATATGLVPAATYSFTPDSIGAIHVIWKNGTTIVSTTYYNVFMPVVSSIDFFDLYPTLEDQDEKFPSYERRVRAVIETYTGQKFGPYTNKTLRIQGDDGESQELPVKCRALVSVSDTYGSDYTDLVEVAPGTGYFLQYKHSWPYSYDTKRDISYSYGDFFNSNVDFVIVGDFGWPYVPPDVSEAASILLYDEFTEANDLRKHGFNEAQLGDFSYKLNADQWGTTGNTQADLILAPYVQMNLGWI